MELMNSLRKAAMLLFSAVIFGACSANLSTSKSAENKGGDGWGTYKSDKYGYSIQHPKGWTVEDKSTENTRQFYVYEPSKRAFVKIDAYVDDRVNSTEAMKSVIAAFKERMAAEEGMTVKQFKDSVEGETGGWIAVGEQTFGKKIFVFESKGLVSTKGRTLIFHRSADKDAVSELDEVLDKIIKSFSLG